MLRFFSAQRKHHLTQGSSFGISKKVRDRPCGGCPVRRFHSDHRPPPEHLYGGEQHRARLRAGPCPRSIYAHSTWPPPLDIGRRSFCYLLRSASVLKNNRFSPRVFYCKTVIFTVKPATFLPHGLHGLHCWPQKRSQPQWVQQTRYFSIAFSFTLRALISRKFFIEFVLRRHFTDNCGPIQNPVSLQVDHISHPIGNVPALKPLWWIS